MKVGDLVKALIVNYHPIAVISHTEPNMRFGVLYHVVFADPKACEPSFPFTEKQLEVVTT